MPDSHPTSPLSRPRPSSQTNPRSRSRSLTPRHEYTPSPPRRSSHKPTSTLTPPSRKRYRSPSPRTSPPRKYYRPRHTRSRSPSPSRHPYQSRPSYRSYRSPSPRNRRSRSRSPDHRYPPRPYRDTRSISPARYRSPPRNIPPSPPIRSSPNRGSPSRRRYYSPPPRPFPSRYGRHFSPQSNRSRHPESRYLPSESQRPFLRPSRPSRSRSPRSRSPRSRRERRRRDKRDKRRRQREPLSPSKRIPDEQVHKLFLEALKLVLKYRRPPFNISVISDYMSSIDPTWSVRKTHYPTFSDLCRLQESRDHLRLARRGESVVIISSKYEPDTLEVKPRDLARKKPQRDRDRIKDEDKSDHIDPIRRRDWDLEERAAARKERFREDKDVSQSITDAPERSRQTSPDQCEEGTIVTRDSNERDISRGSRDDGSGTTTPNGVEAAETNATTRSIHNASPPPDSSQAPSEKPFGTDSTVKAETMLHSSSGPKSGSMPSTTEGDDKLEALS